MDDLSSNYGNYGFGPSIKKSISGKYERFHSSWYNRLDKVGLGMLYESRFLIRVALFTFLATVASFIYMIEDYKQCNTRFVGITHSNRNWALKGFPAHAGQNFFEVELIMRGMFNPNIQESGRSGPSQWIVIIVELLLSFSRFRLLFWSYIYFGRA